MATNIKLFDAVLPLDMLPSACSSMLNLSRHHLVFLQNKEAVDNKTAFAVMKDIPLNDIAWTVREASPLPGAMLPERLLPQTPDYVFHSKTTENAAAVLSKSGCLALGAGWYKVAHIKSRKHRKDIYVPVPSLDELAKHPNGSKTKVDDLDAAHPAAEALLGTSRAAFGLFATADIAADEHIAFYDAGGLTFAYDDEALYNQLAGINFEYNMEYALPKSMKIFIAGNPLVASSTLINHSSSPNVEYAMVVCVRQQADGKSATAHVVVRALRNIAAGEELVADYGSNYFEVLAPLTECVQGSREKLRRKLLGECYIYIANEFVGIEETFGNIQAAKELVSTETWARKKRRLEELASWFQQQVDGSKRHPTVDSVLEYGILEGVLTVLQSVDYIEKIAEEK